MGVTTLEVARIDFNEENASKIRAITEKYGIRPVSIQVKPKCVFGDLDTIVRFCKITGCKNVVISQLPFDCVLGKEERFYGFLMYMPEISGPTIPLPLLPKLGYKLVPRGMNWSYGLAALIFAATEYKRLAESNH